MYQCQCSGLYLFDAAHSNVTLTNSIVFTAAESIVTGSGYSFVNNLFVGPSAAINFNVTANPGNTIQDLSFQSSVFTNQSGFSYNLSHDYHPKAGCNCSDKGVYSGSTPFKDVPEVPYIVEREVNARPTTNQLPFRFRVRTNN